MGDLEKFKDEVLAFGAEACLPKNLQQYWLDYIAFNIDELLEHGKDLAPEILLMIFEIQVKKRGVREISFTSEELFEYLNHLRIEISFERLNRSGLGKIEPATIETIFTDRPFCISDIKMPN